MMKKFKTAKLTSIIVLSVVFVSLCVIGAASLKSISSSRIVLKDQAMINRKILHNSKGDHACDCFPPMIARSPGFKITNIGSDRATFRWVCDEPASYQVNYGVTSSKGTRFPPKRPTTYYKDYSVTVTGLKPSTTYHAGPWAQTKNFRLVKKWIMASKSKTDWTFKTLEPTALVNQKENGNVESTLAISGIVVSNISIDEGTLTWKTNIPSSSQVEYGRTTDLDLKSGENAELTLDHKIQLFDLEPGATYYYRVASKTTANETRLYSPVNTFVTQVLEDRILDLDNFYSTPNPATVMTEFSYYLYQPLTAFYIDIYSLSGKKIASLQSPPSSLVKGWNKVSWNLTDKKGSRLGNGLFIAKFKYVKGDVEFDLKKSIRLSVKN